MPLVLVTSDRFADHLTPPGHPERPERAEAMQVVASRWVDRGGIVVSPRAATDEELARVHDAEHLAKIAATRGRAVMLDPDTFTSPESEEVARLAAGAVVVAVEHVLTGPRPQAPGPRNQGSDIRDQASGPRAQEPGLRPRASGTKEQERDNRLRQSGPRALVMVRPPGHHAESDRAMGFCLYNSVAVGAAAARAAGLSRVAIVDYDVHHGNGTQQIFYGDQAVLFISSHQFPFYPGTGAASETGQGEGRGFTVNVPMEVGGTDADFDLVYSRAVIPTLEQYRPELILVSAGFDAHEDDPLAGMRMTTAGYARLTMRLLQAADTLCDGRIVFVTEGGYDTAALAACCQSVIDLASAETAAQGLFDPLAGDTRRGEDTLAAFIQAHRRPLAG